MNKINSKLTFVFALVVLINSGFNNVTAVPPPMGVNDGDEFNFVVEEYSFLPPEDRIDFGLEDDASNYIFARTGDEFTITVNDATPYDDGSGTYSIDYEVLIKGQTINATDILENGDFIRDTDWDTQLINMQAGLDQLTPDLEAEGYTVSFTYTIVNTNDEFGFFGFLTLTTSEETIDAQVESRFEKSSGVLLYGMIRSTLTEVGNTQIEETRIKRIGYTPPGGVGTSSSKDANSLPGFEFSSILAAFTLVLIPVVLRKRN